MLVLVKLADIKLDFVGHLAVRREQVLHFQAVLFDNCPQGEHELAQQRRVQALEVALETDQDREDVFNGVFLGELQNKKGK